MRAELWCATVGTVLFVGCSEPTGPAPKVAVISVLPDTASIEVRDTIQLSAEFMDSSGHAISGVEAQWSSSDTTLAVVSTTGAVVGMKPGLAWIRAAAGGRRDSARVSVLVPVASLAVLPATLAMVTGSTVLLTPVPHDSEGNYLWGRTTWTSGDTSKAAVVGGASCDAGFGACGLVTGRAAGVVSITAVAGHKRASAQVTVAVVSFTALTTAQDHTCGLTSAGALWCWGLNTVGELAVPNVRFPRTTPGLVRGGFTFAEVSAGGEGGGGFTCGVTTAALAYCWGENNDYGELGSAAPTPDTLPTPVAGTLHFTYVSSGAAHVCGLAIGNVPYCWGDNGANELGENASGGPASATPVPVSGGFRFTVLTAGFTYTCGLTSIGAAYCWGGNDRGQLGDDTAITNGPRPVQGGLTFSSISAGGNHTCGLTSAGAAYCWGSGELGELGTGDTLDSHIPVPVGGGLTFRAIAAGDYSTCGITTSGAAYCWGWNAYGQLGIGSPAGDNDPHPTPLAVSGSLQFAVIETNATETCGITTSGFAYCWGANTYGQVGDGTYNTETSPVLVIGQR